MRALNQKALRDLWHLKGQALAIAFVIASGVAVLIMSLSTLESLQRTTDAYYERYRLANVFATVKRAPEQLATRIKKIPGVQTMETRVEQVATLDIEHFVEPVVGLLVSLPDATAPLLNQLSVQRGSLPRPHSRTEVVLNEPFAEAHNLMPGDQFNAILNGHRRTLRVSGIALSPEYIYTLGPGALMPDDKRFGILWMRRDALSAAYDLKEAFNSVTLALRRDASVAEVIQRLDLLLEPYGGSGAIARADQSSNWFLTNEMKQLATTSKILPAIFLVIAAFLTNMVLSRLLATERSQIGLMKAFGYSNLEVGLHYAKIVAGIVALGILIGVLVGYWFGRINTQMFADVYRFPLLLYLISPTAVVIASALSLTAALLGAASAVAKAVNILPAAAMQPPAPPVYQRSWLQTTVFGQWLDQPTRIILRNISRWPKRSIMTGAGLSASVALLVLALQWNDSLNYLAQSFFYDTQRQHATVGLAESQSTSVLQELKHLPGVMSAEPGRGVSAEFSFGSVTHRGQLTGTPSNATLQPIFDDERRLELQPPVNALILGDVLAEKLGVGIGDHLWVKVLTGRRPEVSLPIADIFSTYIGTPAYTHIETVDRLLLERPSLDYANLLIDARRAPEFYKALKEIPMVSAVMLRQAALDSFNKQLVDHLMVFINMFSSLACILGFGVAYNAARISLSERGRELATLRVLGFTRGEISYILLGEVGLLVVLALPFGCLLGYGLSNLMAQAFNTELFRIPLTIEPATYGASALVAIAATIVSGFLVHRRIDRLNLIEVLKTRE